MVCHNCKVEAHRYGKNRKKQQRFHCQKCSKTFVDDSAPKPLDNMRIPEDKAVLILQLLLEGNSIRSCERITGIHRDTVLCLLEVVGRKCDEFLRATIKNIKVREVEIDEIWSYCALKQATKNRLGYDMSDEMTDDNYCMVGIEKNTKLVLTWHLGRRTFDHARMFMHKLDKVIGNTFQTYQLSSDGFNGYEAAAREQLAGKVDYAQCVKIYGNGFPHQPFEPVHVIAVKKYPKLGNPDLAKATTAHIERLNLDLRTR